MPQGPKPLCLIHFRGVPFSNFQPLLLPLFLSLITWQVLVRLWTSEGPRVNLPALPRRAGTAQTAVAAAAGARGAPTGGGRRGAPLAAAAATVPARPRTGGGDPPGQGRARPGVLVTIGGRLENLQG